jgi:hypothetical protein
MMLKFPVFTRKGASIVLEEKNKGHLTKRPWTTGLLPWIIPELKLELGPWSCPLFWTILSEKISLFHLKGSWYILPALLEDQFIKGEIRYRPSQPGILLLQALEPFGPLNF